ncbi:uncharacterized protein LOC27207180 isoform X2 [Drosophila simulans]|uniref:uncharacterized protein LOC27207180 isoform X2 n=1 Tax=Drosophila simulans TaxID=7240 RepID=UPI00078AE3EC|nr:uncharacterized protein LOC27207180 isoform X2 [Drosophila simulans]KMZ10860.1 uncharacterized protein Dsimw501_GD27330, isoform A [Drosophila simulans]
MNNNMIIFKKLRNRMVPYSPPRLNRRNNRGRVQNAPASQPTVDAEAGPMAEADIEVMEEADLNNNIEEDDMADNDPTAEAEVLARAPRWGWNFLPRLTVRWMFKLWPELSLRLWLKLKLWRRQSLIFKLRMMMYLRMTRNRREE